MEPATNTNPEALKLAFDHTKLAFEFYREMTNQLISLSTGVLAFTVTFSKDVVKSLSKKMLALLGSGWVCYLISIAAGLVTTMGLNGALLDKEAHPLRAAVRIPSMIQILTFLAGTILMVVYRLATHACNS